MSKSNRAKNNRAQRQIEREQKILEQRSKEKRLNKIAAAITASVVAVIIVAVSTYFSINSLLDKGYFLRKNVSVSSSNYEINNSMLSYFFYEEYRNFINENYSELSDMGLDSQKSLKKQDSYYGDGSWYDHFIALTEKRITKITAECEGAAAIGLSLDDTEKKEIEYILKKLKLFAQNSNRSESDYYSYMYGRGVTADDIKECLEMIFLSEKFREHTYSEFSLSGKEYDKYFSETPEKYSTASVLKYTFVYDEFYKSLSENSSYDECIDAINSDIIKNYDENYDTPISADLIDILITSNMTYKYSYSEDKNVDKLAFSKGAKKGDFILSNDDESMDIYVLQSSAQKNTEETKNLRVIYCENEAYGSEASAQNFVNTLYNDVTKAQDPIARFKSLAFIYDEHTSLFGERRNIASSELETNVSSWAFSKGLKKGECEVISGAQGQYLALYESDGGPVWKSGILNDRFEEFYQNKLLELTKKYNIVSNEDNLEKLSI